MRIDCHFHTSRHSCCSQITPERACELAADRGLDALLITEHNQYWDEEALATLQAGFPRIKLYAGIEIALAEGYHVVVIGPRLVQTMAPVISLGQLKAFTGDHRENFFLFVAHAFRYDPTPLPSLPRILDYCDGLEMSSINILRGHLAHNGSLLMPDNNHLYQRYLFNYNLTPLFNTDGHDEAAVGCIANELETGTVPTDEVALARMFKASSPAEYQNQSLLANHPLLSPYC
jgi:hypothetical protein